MCWVLPDCRDSGSASPLLLLFFFFLLLPPNLKPCVLYVSPGGKISLSPGSRGEALTAQGSVPCPVVPTLFLIPSL